MRASRRLVLSTLLLCACAPGGRDSASRSGGDPAAYEVDPESAEIFQLVRVTDGVWALPVRPDRNPSQYAVAVIVERDDHVLVVDSRHTRTSARSLMARVRDLTDKPVRYLVNTHWHGDHVQGNAAFADAYPELEIVGGATIAEDMGTLLRARLDQEIERLDASLEAVRKARQAELGDDGEPMDEDEVATIDRQLAMMEAYREERAGLELVPPDRRVEDVVLLPGRPEVQVIRVGPAHTRGDVVVYLPAERVLILGDLIEDGFPWFGDGYPSGWADALDRLAELDVDVYIPGHGTPFSDPDMFETQRIFVRVLAEEAEAAVARGEGAESILENPAFSGFEDHFTRRLEDYTLQERQERYDAFLVEAFTRAFAEAAGELER